MQSAVHTSFDQIAGSDQIRSPHTAPILDLEFAVNPNVGQPQRVIKRVSADIESVDTFLTTAPTRARMNWGHIKGVEVDSQAFVFCDSTGIVLKRYTDPLPFYHYLHKTIGQFFNSKDDYWYLWIGATKGLVRIRKTELPAIHVPHQYPFGVPFPRYPKPDDPQKPDDRWQAGPSFCADPRNTFWALFPDQRAGAYARSSSWRSLVVVFCPQYFEQMSTHKSYDLLPDTLLTGCQVENTPLQAMKPAWFDWYRLIDEVLWARKQKTSGNYRRSRYQLVKEYDDELDLHQPNQAGLEKDKFHDVEDEKALSADECVILSMYAKAKPPSEDANIKDMPAVYNIPNVIWFIIAVTLQQNGDEPQSWATGFAGDLLPPICADGGGEGGDGGRGGDSGGNDPGQGSSAGEKRPRPMPQNPDGGGGSRPRIGSRSVDGGEVVMPHSSRDGDRRGLTSHRGEHRVTVR